MRNPRPPRHRHDEGHAPGKALAWREVDIVDQAREEQGKRLPMVLAGATLGGEARTHVGEMFERTVVSVTSPFEFLNSRQV